MKSASRNALCPVYSTNILRMWLIGIISSTFIIFFILIMIIWYCRRRRRHGKQYINAQVQMFIQTTAKSVRNKKELVSLDSVIRVSISLSLCNFAAMSLHHSRADGWEIGYERLELITDKHLGSGAFSVVYKGQLKGEAPVYKMLALKKK